MIQVASEVQGAFKAIPSADSSQIQVVFVVPENLSYLSGHFVNFPVLPAVAIVDISLHFVQNFFNFDSAIRLRKIHLMKIKSPIKPGDKIQITLAKDPNKSNFFNCNWSYEADGTTLTELSVELFVH